MTSVLVCVPTVPGRQPFLANCARGYERSKYSSILNLSIVDDARSAGEGWQRCVDQGLEWWPETTHISFSNDDIVVDPDWLVPLLEACQPGYHNIQGCLPAVRVEPAGGHCDVEMSHTHPPMPPVYDYLEVVPRNPMAYFFAGHAHEQPTEDWTVIDHGNLPFCSVEQWEKIGPFPPIHYGSDRWFSEMGRRAGFPTVARLDSVAFNYNANIGRHRGDWEEQDFAAFDGIFAMPLYLNGVLRPSETHPWRETPYGLKLVREWRRLHENPPPAGSWPRVFTEMGRLELFWEWRDAHRDS